MMDAKDRAEKRELVKDILRRLHGGLAAEEAKEEIVRRVGSIRSAEIAEIEQSLMEEGIPADEIRRFCNVHALLFEPALEAGGAKAAPQPGAAAAGHPLDLLQAENREIEKAAADLAMMAAESGNFDPTTARRALGGLLARLSKADTHYVVKEQALFPFLEKTGFTGPSRVMWGKHNEIRGMLRAAREGAEKIADAGSFRAFVSSALTPLLEEVKGMIFKEENILFPASREKIPAGDWPGIGRSALEIGYAFLGIGGTPAAASGAASAAASGAAPGGLASGTLQLPTGNLSVAEWEAMMNALPFDVTFVDADDTVRYYSDTKDRVFVRTPSVIGRSVQNCHPPQSLGKVNEILSSFRAGTRDAAEFWIRLKGRVIHIRYFAVRDGGGKFLGTVETTQDITDIQKLSGEKRLMDR